MKPSMHTMLSLALIAGMSGACLPVRPEADYRRAGNFVQEHVGGAEVYQPQDDAAVEKKVNDLLADGLTVDEAVMLGLINNRGLQAAFYDIGVSRAEVVQSVLPSNPEFSAVGLLPEGGGRANLQVGLAQQIADLWQIPVRKKMAEAQLEATILNIARQAIVLAACIRGDAYNVLALRQVEATAQENVQLAEQSEELARRRLEAGETGQLDVNLAKSRTIAARVDLLQVRRERQLAEATLAHDLNLSGPDSQLHLVGELPPMRGVPPAGDLFMIALDHRLDARAANHSIDAAEAQMKNAFLKIFPSLTLGFECERLEARALPGRKILADTVRESIAAGQLTAPSIQPVSERRREKRLEIDAMLGPSFGMTLPIWDQNQAQIAIARYRLAQAYKQYEELLNSIADQVVQAAITLENAGQIAAYYRDEGLPQATRAWEIARELYQAGEQGIIPVIEAQETLVSSRQAYVRIVGDYARAMAELEQVIGGSLPAEWPTSQPATSRPAESLR